MLLRVLRYRLVGARRSGTIALAANGRCRPAFGLCHAATSPTSLASCCLDLRLCYLLLTPAYSQHVHIVQHHIRRRPFFRADQLHVQYLVTSNAQALYALKILRVHGLCDSAIQAVFSSVFGFWATVCKTVRPMLLGRCLSCPVCLSLCDVRVLWPNGWTNQDATSTWYGGMPRPRRHCVRWGPSSPPTQKGGTAALTFRPMSTVTKRSPIAATAELFVIRLTCMMGLCRSARPKKVEGFMLRSTRVDSVPRIYLSVMTSASKLLSVC